MNILCLGISYHTASVSLREQISLSGERLRQALRCFAEQPGVYESLTEAAILSTCSRLEFYAVTSENVPAGTDGEGWSAIFEPLMRYSLGVLNARRDELEPHLYCYSGERAAHHLCRVAASLDSMVLGEPQILGQVSSAHRAALEQGSARHVLSSLFRSAVHAGKRARSETAIGRHPTHMSAVAIRLAESVLGNLAGCHALVVGTGEIGQQSIKALRDHGILKLSIASHSRERAASIAREWNAQPVTVDDMEEAMLRADVVLSSSNQAAPVIDRAMAARAAARRPERPLVLVDLGVPRNIDPSIRTGGPGTMDCENDGPIEGVYLFDLDDIQSFIHSARASRKNEIPRAEEIMAEETAGFMRWLSVIPVVGELHRRAEGIRQQEVGRALHILQDADPVVVEQIEKLSQSLVRKLLHEPTTRLRHELDHTCLETYMTAITSLFDLTEAASRAQGKGGAS